MSNSPKGNSTASSRKSELNNRFTIYGFIIAALGLTMLLLCFYFPLGYGDAVLYVFCFGPLCPLGLLLSILGQRKSSSRVASVATIVGGLGTAVFVACLGILWVVERNMKRGYQSLQAQRRLFEAHEAIDMIRNSAIQRFMRDCRELPTSLTELLDNEKGLDCWKGPYVSNRTSLIDPWGNPFRYSLTGREATISSDGPDESPGTDDDLTRGLHYYDFGGQE